jgi:hypothetical protein
MTKAEAVKALRERRKHPPNQIDNSSLYAGSDMYYYCISCGALADQLPETHMSRPKKLCNECQEMKDNGWLNEKSKN